MESDHDSNRLSEDLWREIFNRLPIKALGQCRCVCKPWNSLISSPSLVSNHHSFSSSTTPANRKTYFVHVSHRYAIYHPQDLVQHIRNVHVPFQIESFSLKLKDFVDIIHGVVCLSYLEAYDSTILWNPAIHKYVALPCLPCQDKPLETSRKVSIGLGFGYDSCKKDFKVVRVSIPFTETNPTILYNVYSSQEGLWREAMVIDNIKSGQFITKTSCFLNGTIHWLVRTRNFRDNSTVTRYLLMFDCRQEKFKTMELPEELLYRFEKMDIIRLIKYSGMLSVLKYSSSRLGLVYSGCLELWVMEEHGVAHTWKKLFSIVKEIEFDKNVVMLREDGDIYQMERVSYDPNRWIKIRGLRRFYQPLNGFLYGESMFLIDDTKFKSYTKEDKIILYLPHSRFL